jgi:anti-sigma factor RsiW
MMTACSYSDKVGAYHDGELDPSARMQMEIHISHCRTCAAELASLKAMSQLLTVAQPRLSQMSAHRLHNRAQMAMDEGLVRFARVVSGIAAVILVAASAGLVYRSSQAQMLSPGMTPANTVAVAASTEVNPPWVEVPVATDNDATLIAESSPVAVYYLSDASEGLH